MTVARSNHVSAMSKLLPWAGSLLAFLAASGVQAAIYGAGATSTGGLSLPEPVEFLVLLAWILVPAGVATWNSLRLLRSVRAARDRLVKVANVTLLLFAPLSVYLGLFISFNTWGT
jgi:hypothetical protein